MENRRLRAVLVELAWRMVRFQPRYHPVQKNRLAVLAKGGRAAGAQRKRPSLPSLVGSLWPLEASYRALHTHDPRIQVKAKEVFLRSSRKQPFGTWRVFAA